ncbi:MAG: 30S ribosomal protein S17, partial [Patescibacteria group bacterium]
MTIKANKVTRQFQGEVIRASSQKTVYVKVASVKTHQKYRKQYTTTSIYPVHDEKALAKVGNEVIFEECRP